MKKDECTHCMTYQKDSQHKLIIPERKEKRNINPYTPGPPAMVSYFPAHRHPSQPFFPHTPSPIFHCILIAIVPIQNGLLLPS